MWALRPLVALAALQHQALAPQRTAAALAKEMPALPQVEAVVPQVSAAAAALAVQETQARAAQVVVALAEAHPVQLAVPVVRQVLRLAAPAATMQRELVLALVERQAQLALQAL